LDSYEKTKKSSLQSFRDLVSRAMILKIKRGQRARALRGHPWVYSTEVVGLLDSSMDGEVVECRDSGGESLGWGIYNGRSRIVWRRISGGRPVLDQAFFMERVHRAVERRNSAYEACRLIWSESDYLPGLIVDRFGKVLVGQLLTLAMDRHRLVIERTLQEVTGASSMIWRNDAPSRTKEGLKTEITTAFGEPPKGVWVRVNNARLWAEFTGGHKTGLYLDQQEEYRRVASLAKGCRVLDAFCYHAGFGIHCALADATSVIGVDSSQKAIDQAKINAAENGVKVHFVCDNVFDYFACNHGMTWDLIVLDPPPFAARKDRLEMAMRGYRELNRRALASLSSDGILASYSCSHAVSYDCFYHLLRDAAADAKREVKLLDVRHQPADHPVMLSIPESEYLRGFILKALKD
jgi:23S rRNA (cytosine1962-C5)-methyltransferase